MSIRRTTTVASTTGILTLILMTITMNLRSGTNIISRTFFEVFSSSFAHPLLEYNGTLASPLQFYYLLHLPQITCRKILTVKGNSCQKHFTSIKEICLEESYVPPVGECVALSFGIEDDLYFEDEMFNAFDCKVYIFDPSALYVEGNKNGSAQANGEHYYPIGSLNGSIHFEGLRQEIGDLDLKGKRISFIKIDLWEQEWQSIQVKEFGQCYVCPQVCYLHLHLPMAFLLSRGTPKNQDVIEALLDLGLLDVTRQLTFSSHLNFLKRMDVTFWRGQLQELMDTLTRLEQKGLKRAFYRENRNGLASIQFPGEDIPKPSCGRFLYLRS